MTTPRAALAFALSSTLVACSPGGAPGAAGASPSPASTDPARPLPSPVPEIVARVNGQAIRLQQILPLAKARLDRAHVADRARRKPEVLRAALAQYVERELLLQEALARGISADTAVVERAYDQMRREHPDEGKWADTLASQALDPQMVKDELRSQQTVAELLRREIAAQPVSEAEARELWNADPERFAPRGTTTAPETSAPSDFDAVRPEVERQIRESRRDEVARALVARLRAKARIELFL